MSTQFISPTGLRIDGRRPLEVRHLACKIGVNAKADGSAYLEMGNTKVVATVYGPREARYHREACHDKAIVRVEYTHAHFSEPVRIGFTKTSMKMKLTAELIQETVESALILSLYPRSQIDISVEVLQTDGGEVAAAINAVGLALVDAGCPMLDFVCACTVSMIDNTPLLDVNYTEQGANGPILLVAGLPKSRKIITVHLERKTEIKNLENLLETGLDGIFKVFESAREFVRQNVVSKVESRARLDQPGRASTAVR